MNLTLMVVGALVMIFLFVLTIRPYGRKKSRQSSYSRTDLVALGVAAVGASLILLIKYR